MPPAPQSAEAANAASAPSTVRVSSEPVARPLACDSADVCAYAPAAPVLPRMGGQCPVDHGQYKSGAGGAAAAAASAAAIAHSGSGGVSVVGDVFPDATPSPTQRMALSTAPVASSIPRGGAAPPGQAPLPPDATWIFPSPQRFFNAMRRKGWDPHEPDMAWVVGIHNSVNEQSWQRVMHYESMHRDECPTPKLASFKGRPGDLSPKARVRGWFGAVAPFDRHDWMVDRCGKQVRYIIDFYQGPTVYAPTNAPGPLAGMPPSIHLDVRPALTPGGAIDRMRMQWSKWFPGSPK